MLVVLQDESVVRVRRQYGSYESGERYGSDERYSGGYGGGFGGGRPVGIGGKL